MTTVPTFETERLVIRPVAAEDAPSYQRYFVNYNVVRPLAAEVPWPYPEGGILVFLNELLADAQGKDRWMWAITLKDNPSELIGAVELVREANPANRGFWLGESFWGKGYMMEAVTPITDYAFSALGFEKLIFVNAVGNVRSRRIKEKSGARFTHVEPGRYVDPELTESEFFELTPKDWAAHNVGSRGAHRYFIIPQE